MAVVVGDEISARNDLLVLIPVKRAVQRGEAVPGDARPSVMRVVVGEIQHQEIEPGPAQRQEIRVGVLVLVATVTAWVARRRGERMRREYFVGVLEGVHETQHM